MKSELETTQRAVDDGKNASKERNTRDARAGIGQAFRLSSEFIAGVVVGAGIGYLVDTLFGTSPWGLIFFLLLGFAAAILNVMRAAGMVAESQMRLKPAHELHKQHENDDSGSAAKK
ncbi:MAG: AtpZ/AtpI family protein [Rhizobiaceae bacterium]